MLGHELVGTRLLYCQLSSTKLIGEKNIPSMGGSSKGPNMCPFAISASTSFCASSGFSQTNFGIFWQIMSIELRKFGHPQCKAIVETIDHKVNQFPVRTVSGETLKYVRINSMWYFVTECRCKNKRMLFSTIFLLKIDNAVLW